MFHNKVLLCQNTFPFCFITNLFHQLRLSQVTSFELFSYSRGKVWNSLNNLKFPFSSTVPYSFIMRICSLRFHYSITKLAWQKLKYWDATQVLNITQSWKTLFDISCKPGFTSLNFVAALLMNIWTYTAQFPIFLKNVARFSHSVPCSFHFLSLKSGDEVKSSVLPHRFLFVI